MVEVEQCLQMVDLKARVEKKTKFVQYFPDMVKEVEAIMRGPENVSHTNQYLDNSVTFIDVPEFNYEILGPDEI